eukprot:scaffold2509_cov169-Amphora_coffeaeformis.AAC.7
MPKGKPNLTKDQRRELIADLLDSSYVADGERRLARGAVSRSAFKFSMSRMHVYRLWKQAMESRANGQGYAASPDMKGKVGRHQTYDRDGVLEEVESIPFEKRRTLRDLAGALGISIWTCHKMVKDEKILHHHSSPLKPMLSEHDKVMRFMYACERVVVSGNSYMFDPSFDEIHIDEKWFYITEQNMRVYMTPNEIEKKSLQRETKHKSHLIKVMFIAAVARPRFDEEGNCMFDGKIGLWPVTEQYVAKVNSKHRPAGTIETKPKSVDKEFYKEVVIHEVLPAAVKKMRPPRSSLSRWNRKVIRIQHDNPHTHFNEDDTDWQHFSMLTHEDVEFKLVEQPARSPDTNILDLGFFASLQAATWRLKRAKTIDGLIKNVMHAWNDYDPAILNRIWLSHQSVCDEIIKSNGSNDFTLPHTKKEVLEHINQLPVSFSLSEDAITSYNRLR